jgi:mono/diheme cytochrome c family protein
MTMMQPRPRPDSSTALLAWTMLLCLPLALTTRAPAAVDNQTGEQIYQQQCLSCHGKQGEGSKTYGHPLEGDRSVGQLAK